ncbi:hypothetical protein V6N13_142160 [Hibiscus sabdariffa]|uniref:C2H2-type domain-containing protein n=1 Tax=Hibiscus sabdariffa TaxID=183260 RepID=A0ABR2FDD5_9ROSI
MWNAKAQPHEPDDGSWEVRAFAKDTGNATWPPRSYTCTFCRREFRSAQALGGHMNVHRQDRARLHQIQPPGGDGGATVPSINHASVSPSSTTQEFATNSGLCLLYQPPSPNGVLSSPPINTNSAFSIDSTSTLLSISPYYPSNSSTAVAAPPSINFLGTPPRLNSSSLCHSTKAESSTTSAGINLKETSTEDLDLELRLGNSPTTP